MENDETNQIAGFGEFRGLLANWDKKNIHPFFNPERKDNSSRPQPS